jgi:6-phosphogluconolactonase
MEFYIGTYTRGTESDGIYHLHVDDNHYQLTCVAAADNPSWLVSNGTNLVYAVSEVSDGNSSGGSVSVFQASGTAQLKLLETRQSLGDDPCHLALNDHQIIISNYTSGSVVRYTLDKTGTPGQFSKAEHHGSGPDPQRQASAHAHSSLLTPDGIIVADLGMDRLMIYDTALEPQEEIFLTAGAGPRLMAATHDHLYVICELSNTIETFRRSEKFEHLDSVSTLPDNFNDASFTAHLELSADNRFLYASNRGHDSIVVMAINDGRPQPVQWIPCGGRHPRHFTLTRDETRLMVANRDDNNITFYGRDRDSGLLKNLDQVIEVPAPVCILQV